MDLWLKYAIVIVSSYLLGSLNFAIIVSKLFLNKDIRKFGSGNAGGTNAYRVMGGKKALLVAIGDILKGVIAVLIAGFIFGELTQFGGIGKLIAGIFVVLGHVYPLYFGFKGGKGVLTGAAMLCMFDIRVAGIALAVFAIIVVLSRYVSLGSVIASLFIPIGMFLMYKNDAFVIPYMIVACILAIGLIFLHRSNIKRLLNGTENKFELKKNKVNTGGNEK